MFYLTTHSTHFIYGYTASGIWNRTILIARKEIRCRHMGYSFRLAGRVLLYAPSHRQLMNSTICQRPSKSLNSSKPTLDYHLIISQQQTFARSKMCDGEVLGKKEGNILFNNTLNTYLRLYGIGHRVK